MLATMLIPILMFTPASIQGREAQVLRQFAASLNGYSRLHQAASESVPRTLCGGPEDLEAYRTMLGDEIRRLRAREREGSIFTSEVGALLRRRLSGIPAVTTDEEDAEGSGGGWKWTTEVNAALPPYFGDQLAGLVHHLPPLPGELEYRFVGRDLVLLDVIANVVVDVLRDAIR